MKIEDQIKQNKFANEIEKTFVNISYTYNYINSLLSSKLKPYGISIQQFNVMRILKGSNPEPVAVNEITKRMIDKMSNASRLVEKLRIKGLVERSVCSYDKRQVDICITPKGIKLLEQMSKEVSSVINDHNHISNTDLSVLNETLDAFRKS